MGSSNYFDVIKALLHTLVRFMPLSLYSFSYLSVAIYKDLRSAILLIIFSYLSLKASLASIAFQILLVIFIVFT